MDKKGTRILVGCILCTTIVLMLFIIVIKFTQLSCELVALEPVALRSSQLDSFQRDKPIRSHDKTIIMKISAFLEYNVQETTPSAPSPDSSKSNTGGGTQADPPKLTNGIANNISGQAVVANNAGPLVQPPVAPLTGGPLAGGSANNRSLPLGGPQPSMPQNNFNPLQNASFLSTKPLSPPPPPSAHQAVDYGQHQHPRAEKRYLPLELKSIETRNMGDHKQRYILSFNCTKLNMILVHVNNTVYVEKMDMELKSVGTRQQSTCELTLAGGRAFMVPAAHEPPAPVGPPVAQTPNVATNVTGGGHPSAAAAAATAQENPHPSQEEGRNMVRYFCDKPLRFECHYWSKRGGPAATNGFLLADLQINAIEFETSRNPSSKGQHKHVKSEFKSKRSVCL